MSDLCKKNNLHSEKKKISAPIFVQTPPVLAEYFPSLKNKKFKLTHISRSWRDDEMRAEFRNADGISLVYFVYDSLGDHGIALSAAKYPTSDIAINLLTILTHLGVNLAPSYKEATDYLASLSSLFDKYYDDIRRIITSPAHLAPLYSLENKKFVPYPIAYGSEGEGSFKGI